jgi:hypothetical protein
VYDLLQPHVSKIVMCDPRRNALLKEGSKSDRIDARKLAELLRGGLLRPVYRGETGLRPTAAWLSRRTAVQNTVTHVNQELYGNEACASGA